MTSREFCYWLQGYFELKKGGATGLSPEQEGMVRRHLALVFQHDIDPSEPGDQSALQAIHDGKLTPELAVKAIERLTEMGLAGPLTSCSELLKDPQVNQPIKAFIVDWYGNDDMLEVIYVKDLLQSLGNRIQEAKPKAVMRC